MARRIRETFNQRAEREMNEAWDRVQKNIDDREALRAYIQAKNKLENPPWKPLLYALMGGDGHLQEVIKHTNNGKDIPMLNREGVALLMQPAYAGDEKILDFLLSKGADPNIDNSKEGLSALSMAAMKDHVSIFKKLLKAGADPSICTRQGDTLINIATYNDAEGVLKILKNKSSMTRLTNQAKTKPAPKP